MLKKLILGTFLAVATMNTAIPVTAQETIPYSSASVAYETVTSDLEYLLISPSGKMSRQSIKGNVNVPSGWKVTITSSNGIAFSIQRDTEVEFSLNLDKAANVDMGYIRSNSNTYKMDLFNNKTTNPYAVDTMPANDNYQFYLHNLSSDSIKIVSGEVKY